MPPKRVCTSWLQTFSDWTLPRSEAPESFHFWTGVFTLASVLKRKVKISKSYMGGYEIYPMLYTIFVAPPGKARKSTTAKYSEDLLRNIPTVNRAPTSMTVEQMLKKLGEMNDSSLSIFSSEFGMFVAKSKIDMYTALTDIFDSKTDISVETIGRPTDFAEAPCINLLGATTPSWIASNMPEDVIGGGFASRVIFIFEERIRRAQLYYTGIDQDYFSTLKEKLLADLMHIDTYIQGEYALDDNAQFFMNEWYRELSTQSLGNLNERLSGYYERKPVHVHKLAMLIHASYSDSMTLNESDFKAAIKILEQVEVKLPKTFASIGRNPYMNVADNIVNFMITKRSCRRSQIVANFYHDANMETISELLMFLRITGRLQCIVPNAEDPIWEFVK